LAGSATSIASAFDATDFDESDFDEPDFVATGSLATFSETTGFEGTGLETGLAVSVFTGVRFAAVGLVGFVGFASEAGFTFAEGFGEAAESASFLSAAFFPFPPAIPNMFARKSQLPDLDDGASDSSVTEGSESAASFEGAASSTSASLETSSSISTASSSSISKSSSIGSTLRFALPPK
jgi:hypothetical protein